MGSFAYTIFHFYDSLAGLARFPHVPRSQQNHIMKKVSSNQAKMKKWADLAPMNFLHKWYLVEAERNRVLGKGNEAMEDYDRAVEIAKDNEYLNEEALASELAAEFYSGRGKDFIAAAYMERARNRYSKWGAEAKVQDLEGRYARLLDSEDKR